jgi:DNA-binding NarL/FixJ family response regulator
MKATVIIADDHKLFIEGLERILSEMPTVTLLDKLENGKEVLRNLNNTRPDLILMDIDMPIMNGIDALSEIRKLYPEQKVIMLSMHGEKRFIQEVLKLGANGYILKSSSKEDFQEGINRVLQGGKYFSSEVTIELSQSNSTFEIHLPNSLSSRENDIIKLVAEGMSSKEIAAHLNISVRTVETHRKNIMTKMNFQNMADLIRYAIKTGIA